MTRAEFDLFLLSSAILCLIMAIFNAVRPRKRSFALSGAFLAVAATLILYRQDAEQGVVIAAGAVAFIFLVADFMVKARNHVPGGVKK